MKPSYPIKNWSNPPNLVSFPHSPITPPTKFDDYYPCPAGSTCCCAYDIGNFGFEWGCCYYESSTYSSDNYHFFPHDFPLCDLNASTCIKRKNDRFGFNILKITHANPHFSNQVEILATKQDQ
jgi:hypothetical protein